ncbi:MAG TPA: radical SAM/SPASM domain-containing protein, partial [Thermoanaerobaculia bacterium]|nr:radical SAM/SPASM domain-containing protein [Thermoanaerobaculia bacterium]
MRGTHGWAEISAGDKQAIIEAIVEGKPTPGPFHIELDLTDRCNVDCYFCNQMDVRTKEQIPLHRVTQILDEMTPRGLRSVRLSGGGDPLFHREIAQVIDAIHQRGVVIDNITTNGLGLTEEVASKLVERRTREVVLSLNAADAADYARMMQVKPAVFDKVIANAEKLMALRGEGRFPCLVVQFLLDRKNYSRLPEMYALGRRLGADVIAVGIVLEIPNERIDASVLLEQEDAEKVRPYLRETLLADRDAHKLQALFALPSFDAVLADLEREIGSTVDRGFTTAPAFKEENGACFFGFYSAVVRGNGDLYPCCMLLNPLYTPLGNAMEGSFAGQWTGPKFDKLRHEMREVMLAGGEAEYQPGKYETLAPQCVNAYACGLKNMYFRSDETFYADLGAALEKTRSREIRWTG